MVFGDAADFEVLRIIKQNPKKERGSWRRGRRAQAE